MLGPSRTQLDVCHDVCDVIRKEATSREKKERYQTMAFKSFPLCFTIGAIAGDFWAPAGKHLHCQRSQAVHKNS